jgi:hypothetical protein
MLRASLRTTTHLPHQRRAVALHLDDTAPAASTDERDIDPHFGEHRQAHLFAARVPIDLLRFDAKVGAMPAPTVTHECLEEMTHLLLAPGEFTKAITAAAWLEEDAAREELTDVEQEAIAEVVAMQVHAPEALGSDFDVAYLAEMIGQAAELLAMLGGEALKIRQAAKRRFNDAVTGLILGNLQDVLTALGRSPTPDLEERLATLKARFGV